MNKVSALPECCCHFHFQKYIFSCLRVKKDKILCNCSFCSQQISVVKPKRKKVANYYSYNSIKPPNMLALLS